jgi:hypothetical protein
MPSTSSLLADPTSRTSRNDSAWYTLRRLRLSQSPPLAMAFAADARVSPIPRKSPQKERTRAISRWASSLFPALSFGRARTARYASAAAPMSQHRAAYRATSMLACRTSMSPASSEALVIADRRDDSTTSWWAVRASRSDSDSADGDAYDRVDRRCR